MSDESRRRATLSAEHPGARENPDPSLQVYLLAGLPTEPVREALERAGEWMPVVPLDALGDSVVGDATRLGVLLPAFVEPSLIIESWKECDFLPFRFGRPAHIAGVSVFLDVDRVDDHLGSADALSLHEWGRTDLDGRSVADIVVGQIESATHLVLIGADRVPGSLARRLGVLNPSAALIPSRDGSSLERSGFTAVLGSKEPPALGGADATRLLATRARSVGFAPPWLEVLRGERDSTSSPDLFHYLRARPFDVTRLRDWVANPPGELLRGKGHVWLGSEPEQSFGYSCAGSVHRLFPAGRWWASLAEGEWPKCTDQRRRLLERWHPRFGDRRQELVFAGVDIDTDRLSAELDACLLAEEEIDDGLQASWAAGAGGTPRAVLH